MQELRNIRHKVDVLDNKSVETRHNPTHYHTTHLEPLDNLTAGIAESKVEATSQVNFSRERSKQTGKILRKSQVQTQTLVAQELSQQVLDHNLPKQEASAPMEVKEEKPERKKTEPKQVEREAKQKTEPKEEVEVSKSVNANQPRKEEEL